MEVNKGASTSKNPQESGLIQENDILPGCNNFDDFLQTAYPFVMKGVKSSNCLPSDKQFSYYTTFPEFKNTMKEQEVRVQYLMQKLLKYSGGKRLFKDQSLDNKFDLVIDINDILLERVSKNLRIIDSTSIVSMVTDYEEEASKNISGSWNRHQMRLNKRFSNDTPLTNRNEQHIQNKITKPQAKFKEKIDNSNETWIPKIKDKPNSLKPLSILLTVDNKNNECYTHPYDYELTLLRVSEKRLQLIDKPKFPNPVGKTSLIMIENENQVDGLIDDLLQQEEISVDLEHHSFRTFMGITCLVQISTRHKDYLIDGLSLRQVLYKLNEVFTKPSILKIFHSADSDIEWLQRDFGVYVVNMFDTCQAAKMLGYPKLGLSCLLKKFCNIDSDKRFQLFDWRIRPIPDIAKNYARIDTHYLIYIYEMLTNELIIRSCGQSKLLAIVFQRSTETCKRIYHKPILTENSYMTFYRKSKRLFDSRQLYALKEIYKWRDMVAREEDESTGYILSNHMMMQICQTLPREMQGILACCNPVPPLVRQHLLTLHNIVLKAKEQPLIIPSVEESAKPSTQFSASRDFDIEAKISTYIHDNAGLEFRDDYPTLLGQLSSNSNNKEESTTKNDVIMKDNIKKENPISLLQKNTPKLSLLVNTVNEFINLERNDSNDKINVDHITAILEKVKFMTPYQRYKQVLPYSRKLEEEEREKRRLEEEKNQERLMKSQYNIVTPSLRVENKKGQENIEESQEKENILKRKDVKTEVAPLSADNPGKRRRMMQKFDICEPKDDVVNSLLPIVKEEENSNKIGSTNEGTVGVVGGEVSLEGRSHRHVPRDNKRKHQDFTPYDYNKVDFSKFQSNASQNNKSGNGHSDTKFQGKIKRNKKFHGKQNFKNRKQGKF